MGAPSQYVAFPDDHGQCGDCIYRLDGRLSCIYGMPHPDQPNYVPAAPHTSSLCYHPMSAACS